MGKLRLRGRLAETKFMATGSTKRDPGPGDKANRLSHSPGPQTGQLD